MNRFAWRTQALLSSTWADDEGTPQCLAHFSSTVKTIENRLLHLIKQRADGLVALDDFISELSFLAKDLVRCSRQIAEMQARRDLGFKAIATLGDLSRNCVWLYRKIHQEEAFFKKLHLEVKLRSLISAEAFAVYQELLSVDAQEGLSLADTHPEIGSLLLSNDTGWPS